MDEIRQRLLSQAFLYDHPEAYTSGVEAALTAVERLSAPHTAPAAESVRSAPVQRVRRSAS